MNTNLLEVVKQIAAQNGEDVLGDHKRLAAFFGDLAKDEPKPLRMAFCRAVEEGAYDALKSAPDAAERAQRKTAIAQRVRDEHGFDAALCGEALDILEAALFGEENMAQAAPSGKAAKAPKPVTCGTAPPAKMEAYLKKVKKDGNALAEVPQEHRTAELCSLAIKKGGLALEYVPLELKTAELCLIAVKEHGNALEFVPETLKTAELCLEAIRQYGGALRYVPEALKTAELCLEAVRHDGDVLEFVPENLKTAELCIEAVKNGMFAEDYVPPALKAQVEAAANPQSAPPQAAPASKKPAAASAPPAPPPQPAPAPEPAAQPKKKGFFGGLLGGIQKEITSTLAEGLKSAGLNVETPAPAKKAPSIFSKNIELWNGISTNMTRAQAIAQMNEIMPNAEILNSNDGASVLFKSEYLIRFASYLYGKSFSYTPVFKNNLKTLFENETAEAIKLAGIAYYNERPVIVGLYYRLKDSDQCMKYYDEVTKLLNKRYGENKYLKDHRSHFRMYVWESRGKIIEHEDSGVFSFLVRYIDKDAYVEACRATSQRGEAKAAEVARQKQALKEAAEEQIRKNIIV